LAIAAG